MKKENYESAINVHESSKAIKDDKMRETYVNFMIKRFIEDEQSYVHITYAQQWVDRFLSGEPELRMDSISYSIYQEVRK